MYKWEIKQGVHRAYYAVFTYRGEVMFSSPRFASKQSVKNLIEDAKKNVADAVVWDNT